MSITDDIERLVELFEEIERYIMEMVAEIIISNPGAYSLRFWRRRAQAVHTELEALRSDLLKVTPDVANHAFQAGYLAGGHGDDQLTTGINTRAVALLAAGMNDKLDAALATVGRRVDDTFRRAGLKAASLHGARDRAPTDDARLAAPGRRSVRGPRRPDVDAADIHEHGHPHHHARGHDAGHDVKYAAAWRRASARVAPQLIV